MKTCKLLFLTITILLTFKLQAQMGIGTTTPDVSAQLDVTSKTKGFLPPRLTSTERDAIVNPAEGLIIYNLTSHTLEIRGSNFWYILSNDNFVISPLDSVRINNIVWLRKNLEVSTFSNGDVIPQVTVASNWASTTSPAWCYYNNDPSLAKFGKLYNGYTIADSRGLCPTGWHVATKEEWQSTWNFMTVGSGKNTGMALEKGTANWIYGNNTATDLYRFTALPSGWRDTNGIFTNLNDASIWYTSTYRNDIWYRFPFHSNFYTNYNSSSIYEQNNAETYGFSVRCVLNQ